MAEQGSTGDWHDDSTGVVDRLKDSATAQLRNQKNRGVDAIDRVADAVRSSTQKLRDDRHDTIAGYIDQAADSIKNLSQRLRDKDVDELMDDVQRLARRQPAVFIGSAFALGLIGARFLKSSRQRSESDYDSESRRMRHGGNRGREVVHDYSAARDRDDAVIASEVAISDAPIDPIGAPVATSGTESTVRPPRGRRPTARTEQS